LCKGESNRSTAKPDDNANKLCQEAQERLVERHLAVLADLHQRFGEEVQAAQLAELDAVLGLVAERPLKADSTAQSQLERELHQAHEVLQARLKLLAEQPLAGENYLSTRVPFTRRQPLRAWFEEAGTQIHRAGQASCSRLRSTTSQEMPDWTALVDVYCVHFGSDSVAERPPRGRVEIAFQNGNWPQEQERIFRKSLERSFRDTFWGMAAAPIAVRATIFGNYEAKLWDQTVVLHATYSRDDLGYSIPPGHLMVVPQMVDFPYEVRDHWGQYEANLKITFDFSDGSPPLVESFRQSESLHGRDHNVTFEPANVHPVHQRVPSADAWLELAFAPFATNLRDSLNARWTSTFCQVGAFSLNAAARCLLAGVVSETALPVVESTLADDGRILSNLAMQAVASSPMHAQQR
jgi:hypothetical protein